MIHSFSLTFRELTGHTPFPWQQRLYESLMKGKIPERCDIPTGLGKTAVIPIWLLAFLNGATVPRRLVYVVNRRTIVDQSTDVVMGILEKMEQAANEPASPLHALNKTLRELDFLNTDILLGVSTLRGEKADNEEWLANPAAPAVIVGTVDMIGSKLLFRGYGDSRRKRPLNAAFLGCDTLVIHDEAHLSPAFGKLLFSIREQQGQIARSLPLPGLEVMELSATHSRPTSDMLTLADADYACPLVNRRVHAAKAAYFYEVEKTGKEVLEKMKERLLHIDNECAEKPGRVLVFIKSPDEAAKIAESLKKMLQAKAKEHWESAHPEEKLTNAIKTELKTKTENRVALLTGRLRGYERDRLLEYHPVLRIFTGVDEPAETSFLVATSAGEVGINLDADYMVCDLTPLDSMIQRLGRLNRFGKFPRAEIHIVVPSKELEKLKDGQKKALRDERPNFVKQYRKELARLKKNKASRERKVRLTEQQVIKQEEKIATAKTEKAAAQARAKKEKGRKKLAIEKQELSDAQTQWLKHKQSRKQQQRKKLQAKNREFIRENTANWTLHCTKRILKQNRCDLSPAALQAVLADPASRDAFPVEFETYPLTSLLLDLWAQTSIQHNPACPQVESWLHGKREEIPETRIGWREELNVFGAITEQNAAKWFDLFPMRTRETLRYPSSIIKKRDKNKCLGFFLPLLQRLQKTEPFQDVTVVIIDRNGNLKLTSLKTLCTGTITSDLDYATIVLPTKIGGLDNGSFSNKSTKATDVAPEIPCRVRIRRVDENWDWCMLGSSQWRALPSSIRLSAAVDAISNALSEEHSYRDRFKAQVVFADEFSEDETETEEWLALFQPLTRPRSASSPALSWPTVREHEESVRRTAEKIAQALGLPEDIIRAIVFAARHHDEGKAAEIWQNAAGHSNPAEPLAKGNVNWRKLKGYRHEAAILLSPSEYADFVEIEEQDLALHLICAHHGWARPHIKPEAFPEDISLEFRERLVLEMMTRYERLQNRFGWWDLAFLESILRRADALASARENAVMEEEA